MDKGGCKEIGYRNGGDWVGGRGTLNYKPTKGLEVKGGVDVQNSAEDIARQGHQKTIWGV